MRSKSPTPGDPLDADDRRETFDKAKEFEKGVARLFRLLGYKTTVDYLRDDQQFDIRIERTGGAFAVHGLVECKDWDRPVGQREVREFASKVEHARRVDGKLYQAILIARSGFVNNAHAVAATNLVELRTFQQLLLSLVDLDPHLEAAVGTFQGTSLERLYVEQEIVLQSGIRPGEEVVPKKLTATVRAWLGKPTGTLFTLLGDFGSGKTSFSQRLACELALAARADAEARRPVVLDLREGGSTTVTLENLLIHRCQQLSSEPVNAQAILHLNREGHLLLIFDGFDEIIGYSEPGRFVENLRQILRACEGKAKVLLTCRTHYFRDQPEEVRQLGKARDVITTAGATQLYDELRDRPGAEIGYLREFGDDEIAEYLRKALPPPADWQAFREEIRRTYNLEDLAERPFLLEMIVKTLPRLLSPPAPQGALRAGDRAEVTIADLYETYCESWFAKSDFRLTLTREHKVALVEYLARLLWDTPEQRVHYQLLAERAVAFFSDQSLSPFDKERIDYEVRTALFLHRDAAGYYNFIHRSFLEFFVARTLREGLARGDRQCLNLRRLTREVVFFLELWPERKKIPELAASVLTGAYQKRVSENALVLLHLHCRAGLGPLVGPGSELHQGDEGLDPLRRAFAQARPREAMQLAGADFSGAELRGVDLSGAVLRGVSFERAELRGASLATADLAKASLRFADARRASFAGADLTRAYSDHADFQEADLRSANLTGADLRFSRFARADLHNTVLGETQTAGAGFLGARGGEVPGPRRLRTVPQLGHAWAVNSVAWHPSEPLVASGSADGTVKIRDAHDGRLILTLEGHGAAVHSVAWDASGERLASGSSDRTVKIWEAVSGRLVHTLEGHENWVRSVAWDASGERLASGSDDRTVKIWEAVSGRLVHTLEGHENWVLSVAWDASGERLASGSYDRTVKIWEAVSGRLVHTLEGHENWVLSVAWDASGERLASGSDDRTVKIWEAVSGRLVHTLEGHENWVLSVAWAASGERLASGSDDRTVKIWEAVSGRLVHTLEGHENWVRSVAWAASGERLASGSDDRTVKIWEAVSGRLVHTLEGHENWVLSVAWDASGERLASGSYDRTVKIWEAVSGRLVHTLEGHENWVLSVAWDASGERLASGSYDRTVKIWEAVSGRLVHTLEGHENGVLSVAWDASGERLASGSYDRTVKIWEAVSGRLVHTLEGHENGVLSVAWDASGERLASGSYDRTVKIWEAVSGRLVHTLEGHENWVLSVAWDASGERLASGSSDRTVKIWEAVSGRLVHTLEGHENWVLSVAWDASGERLASGSSDRTVKIWEAVSGRLVHTLEGHESAVWAVAWAACGRLAAGTTAGSIELWDLAGPEPRRMARLVPLPGGLVATGDGYVDGAPEALEGVRFGDGWALYDLTDVPERHAPERVREALRVGAATSAPGPDEKNP